MANEADSARIESGQIPLFPRDSRAICAEMEFTWREARRFRDDGFLSFDPEVAGTLDESRVAELMFLASLVSAGCSRPVLRQLLATLRRPYCYDVRRVFFAWSSREWRLLPGENDPEGAFFSLLERLRDRDARDTLHNLRDWLDEALDLARDRTHLFAHVGATGSSAAD